MDKRDSVVSKSYIICPHCGKNSHQIWTHYKWGNGFYNEKLKEIPELEKKLIRDLNKTNIDVLSTALCQSCLNISIWYNEEMVYPKTT
jgi:hypothetical protein